MAADNKTELLDLNDFTQGTSFKNMDCTLHSDVNSDHAEIQVVAKFNTENSVKIRAVNISNKEYHSYFGYGDNPPFKNTHMYVPKDTQDNSKKSWLLSKTEHQMKTLISDLEENRVDIEIIIEGFFDFHTKSKNNLGNNYKVISILDLDNHGYTDKPWNITAIYVNEQTNKFKVIDNGIIQKNYKEEQESGIFKDSTLTIPWIKIKMSDSQNTLIIFGIHVPGCQSQNPQKGLEELNNIMKEFEQIHNSDIIALGDFNTTPNNIKKIMNDINILNPNYPTHINPYCKICVYDNVVHYPNNSGISLDLLKIENMHNDSQALISSLIKNRQYYLEYMSN